MRLPKETVSASEASEEFPMRSHSQVDLFGSLRDLRLVVLGRLVPLHGIRKVLIHGITDFLCLTFTQVNPARSARLEAGVRLTLPASCIQLGLEIGQSVQVHTLVLLIQLSGPFLSFPDDLLDIVVDRQTLFRADNLARSMLDHVQQILLVLGGFCGRLGSTSLDNHLIELQLLHRSLDDPLLDRILGDESVDVYLLGLSDTMGTVHSLQVGLRIPIAVKQDHNVGGDQVDTQSSGTRRQQEDELVAAWLVVFVDGSRSRIVIGTSVDSAVF